MSDIHAIIAAAKRNHDGHSLVGEGCARCRAQDILTDHAIAMTEALVAIGDEPCVDEIYHIVRVCLDRIVKEASRG